ncbi:unnamed protein product [Fusarium langsethiae]|nr:unnamed protein product [Fusarium langsethiae]
MSIENLAVIDPFADAPNEEGDAIQYVHVRIQQQTGSRATKTIIQDLPNKYQAKTLLKALKREFACNGTVVQDETLGEVIQLQGDHRTKVVEFLAEDGMAKDMIKLHGY